MKNIKRAAAFAAAILISVSFPAWAFAENDDFELEIISETRETDVVIRTDKGRKRISPYIYGINDSVDADGVTATVIKQAGTALSTYNWETNFSNAGISGMNSNDISLVSEFSSDKWTTPALYTEALLSRALVNDISMRLVTLPMMGYAAKDSMGIVSEESGPINSRWCTTSFGKNGMYLNNPDTEDDVVYIDEYVSYLVNRYGAASEGGINGYFLDSEPDKWHENFAVLGLEPITPEELVNRSAELASSVKTLDRNAFVFGPSVNGIQGCVNLGSSSGWAMRREYDSEYSWFIDYYLSEMRSAGERAGYRLLDCLDVHYYCKTLTPTGGDILYSNDTYSNAYRMQSVRTLWDPEYVEYSADSLMNKQFTPFIPTLQASIRINYPDTRLSFSEYDFGGGSNVSGAIAQVDVLGVFASEEVYMACLNPLAADYEYQKAALNLYTDYDGIGSGFGDTLVYADNDNDVTSSVYAAADSSEPEKLRIILTNKNMVNEKDFHISIDSEEYDYSLSEAYVINGDSASVEPVSTDFVTEDEGSLHFSADVLSVYMLVLDGYEKEFETEITTETEDISVTDDTSSETVSDTEASQATYSETSVSTVNPVDETLPDITVPVITEPVSEISSEITEYTETEDVSESTSVLPPDDTEEKTVPVPVKILVSLMAVTAGMGIVYVLVFDKK